jgi:diacylglycerol kinase (ATP)
VKTTFIVNPTSSSGRTRERILKLEPEIRTQFPDAEILLTEHPGHATVLCRSAIKSGAEIVIAVGGDGTVNEVTNGFFEEGKPISQETKLGILMSGTGGDFRRSIGIPKDLSEALMQIKKGQVLKIDVGLLRCMSHDGFINERYFVNAASFGLSAMAATLVKDQLGKQSRYAYFVAALRALRRAKPTTLKIVVDGKEHELKDVSLLVFANASYFGGAMHIAPLASLTDGLADVICISNVNLWLMAKYIIRLYRGTHLKLKEVSHFRATRIEIPHHHEIFVEADGEPQGRLPATFELKKGAISLVGVK